MPVTITIGDGPLHRRVITVEVHGIVRITEDGYTTTEGLEVPGAKPWYVISVNIESEYGNYGRDRWWATDGDKYLRLETQDGRYVGSVNSWSLSLNGPSYGKTALRVSYSIHPGLEMRGAVEYAIYDETRSEMDEGNDGAKPKGDK